MGLKRYQDSKKDNQKTYTNFELWFKKHTPHIRIKCNARCESGIFEDAFPLRKERTRNSGSRKA
jgi:hypothetical protein